MLKYKQKNDSNVCSKATKSHLNPNVASGKSLIKENTNMNNKSTSSVINQTQTTQQNSKSLRTKAKSSKIEVFNIFTNNTHTNSVNAIYCSGINTSSHNNSKSNKKTNKKSNGKKNMQNKTTLKTHTNSTVVDQSHNQSLSKNNEVTSSLLQNKKQVKNYKNIIKSRK